MNWKQPDRPSTLNSFFVYEFLGLVAFWLINYIGGPTFN
jgi:hypothetical protein